MKIFNKFIFILIVCIISLITIQDDSLFAKHEEKIKNHHNRGKSFIDRNNFDHEMMMLQFHKNDELKKYKSNVKQVGIVQAVTSKGSGVIVKPNKILTATHVITKPNNQKYKPFSIKYFPNSETSKFIKVKKIEQYKNTELTLLTLENDIDDIKPLKISSDKIHQDDKLKLIGYHKVNNNQINQYTSKGKNIFVRDDLHNKDQKVIFNHMKNHKGMSGGPLLNDKNEVVGISSFLYNKHDFSGFASTSQLNNFVN